MAAATPERPGKLEADGEPAAGAYEPRPEAEGYPGLDALFYALSVAVFAASIVTDLFVVIEHWLNTYKSWAYFTIGLAFVPSCFIQILSLKWYQTYGKLKQHQWISHIFHLAIMHRFCFLLNYALKAMTTQISPQKKNWISKIENDALALNLFTAMLISVPQIIFQVYVMIMLQHISFWTSASVIASLCSLTWALASYSLLTERTSREDAQFAWSSVTIQCLWRGGMLASRIAALVFAATCLKAWILLVFAVHTAIVTGWLVHRSASLCLTAAEELCYKCLIGAAYFFDVLQLTDGPGRCRVCLLYTALIGQNAGFYVLYLAYFKGQHQTHLLVVASFVILGGSLIGAASMLIHFCTFQNVKIIKLCKRVRLDPELPAKPVSPDKISGGKSPSKKWSCAAGTKEVDESSTPDTTADKKSLLTNIVQSSEFIEKGIVNGSFAKSDETNVTVQVVVEDSKVANVEVSIQQLHGHAPVEPSKLDETACSVDVDVEKALEQTKNSSTDSLHRQKRRGICSELELDLKANECNIDLDTQLCSQKRRGICSLTQLGLELVTDEDNYVEKSFSLDKIKSNSDVSINVEDKTLDSGIIESLPIKSLIAENCDVMIPENILTRGRLNTPVISENGETTITAPLSEKEGDARKQEEETMSHVTSIHDYENLCPVGVVRPPWCIRSWKGYTDIETYIHDDSVVRDRRRDTLTSTATGTTLSSDFSDATYASLPLRKLIRRSRQDDYLDTLVYDLVDWESASNKPALEETSTTATESIDEQASLFSAKPIVIDEKGGMLALDTILEEREDMGLGLPELSRMSWLGRPRNCAVSSLVATIDEIRRCATDNSPRHVYHRTESQWEDLEQRILISRAHLTKVLFANEHGTALGRTESATGSFFSQPSNDKLSVIREMSNCVLKDASGRTPLINAILSDSPILGPKTDAQSCETEHLLEEDNVYVDMNALGAQKCSSEDHMEAESCHADKDVLLLANTTQAQSKDSGFSEKRTDAGVRKKVAFLLTDEVINDSVSEDSTEAPVPVSVTTEPEVPLTVTTLAQFNIDRRLHAANRPRRKFSLLRERFEPPRTCSDQSMAAPESNKDPNVEYLNQNKALSKLSQSTDDSLQNKQVIASTDSPSRRTQQGLSENLREKRSVFLKQVLSPPRFQGWGKKRSFSPNAKIIPKAH